MTGDQAVAAFCRVRIAAGLLAVAGVLITGGRVYWGETDGGLSATAELARSLGNRDSNSAQ